MPAVKLCPQCKQDASVDGAHVACVVELFKTNVIKHISEWEAMCKPKPVVKRIIRVVKD